MFFSRSFTCPLWPPFSGVYESTSMFQDHPLHSWFQITVKLLIIIPAFFGSPILHSVFFKETLQILTVPTCTTRGPSAATKLPWCLQRAQTCLADLVLSHHTLGSVRPIIEAWISPSKDYRSVELLKSVDEGFDHQWGRTDEDPKPLSWPEIHRCWGKELEPSWTMLPIHTWTKWRFHKPANALGSFVFWDWFHPKKTQQPPLFSLSFPPFCWIALFWGSGPNVMILKIRNKNISPNVIPSCEPTYPTYGRRKYGKNIFPATFPKPTWASLQGCKLITNTKSWRSKTSTLSSCFRKQFPSQTSKMRHFFWGFGRKSKLAFLYCFFPFRGFPSFRRY